MKKTQGKATDLEWYMVMGFTFAVELGQIVLNLFGIGLALNRAVSAAMAMFIISWMIARGGGLSNPARYLSMGGALLGEETPGLDSFFFWTTELALLKWVL